MDDKKQIFKAVMQSLKEHPEEWAIENDWGWRINLKHQKSGIQIEDAFCSLDDYLLLGYPYISEPHQVNFNFWDRFLLWDTLREMNNARKKAKKDKEIAELKKVLKI